jgi:pyrroloquinoline-quinone synthase
VTGSLLSPEGLEERLRAVGAERYHDRHPFHHMMRDGKLDRGQIRLGRSTAIIRRVSRRRTPISSRGCRPRLCAVSGAGAILDHDGDDEEHRRDRPLAQLTDGLGLARDYDDLDRWSVAGDPLCRSTRMSISFGPVAVGGGGFLPD